MTMTTAGHAPLELAASRLDRQQVVMVVAVRVQEAC